VTLKTPLQTQLIICGLGGQGVLFITRLINEAAALMGQDVISSETHGMAMRGGSVVSYVKIGNYQSPLIRAGQADVMLALSENELRLYSHLLKDNCQIYVNMPRGKKHCSINATRIAKELGTPIITNLVLLGYAAGHSSFPIEYSLLKKVLKNISPEKVLAINSQALEEGFKAATANSSAPQVLA
jgi:indolepyruvate ferredoxin oxidoreductase beta subunit